MGESKRKTYTAAFKAKVGLEAIRGVKAVNELGQDYGVHPALVVWNTALPTWSPSSTGTPGGTRLADLQHP